MPRYIDADALREKMFHKAFEEDSSDQKWDSGCWIRYHMFEDTIDSIPTADVVERKKGKWIYLDGLDAFECSFCGRQMVRNIFDYCPWCGAEMERREECTQ